MFLLQFLELILIIALETIQLKNQESVLSDEATSEGNLGTIEKQKRIRTFLFTRISQML